MTPASTRARLVTVIGDVLGVSPTTLTDLSSPHNIDEWDSFNHLVVVAAIEDEFRIRISIDETVTLQSIAIIVDFLQARGIQE